MTIACWLTSIACRRFILTLDALADASPRSFCSSCAVPKPQALTRYVCARIHHATADLDTQAVQRPLHGCTSPQWPLNVVSTGDLCA